MSFTAQCDKSIQDETIMSTNDADNALFVTKTYFQEFSKRVKRNTLGYWRWTRQIYSEVSRLFISPFTLTNAHGIL